MLFPWDPDQFVWQLVFLQLSQSPPAIDHIYSLKIIFKCCLNKQDNCHLHVHKTVKFGVCPKLTWQTYLLVWYGMVWCDMVWYGVIWCGMVWYRMVWYPMDGMVWYNMAWYGVVWYGWYGMVWGGMVYGMVWYLNVKQCKYVRLCHVPPAA